MGGQGVLIGRGGRQVRAPPPPPPLLPFSRHWHSNYVCGSGKGISVSVCNTSMYVCQSNICSFGSMWLWIFVDDFGFSLIHLIDISLYALFSFWTFFLLWHSLFSRLGSSEICFEGQDPRQIEPAAALEMAGQVFVPAWAPASSDDDGGWFGGGWLISCKRLKPLRELLTRQCHTLTRFPIRRLSKGSGREGGVEAMLGAGLGELLLRCRAWGWRPL